MAPSADGWNAVEAIRACDRQAWHGTAWRIHRERYRADDPGGSLKVSGRYHQGRDIHPDDQVFAALYVALSPDTALAELVRHLTPELLPALNSYRLTRLELHFNDVLDLDQFLNSLMPQRANGPRIRSGWGLSPPAYVCVKPGGDKPHPYEDREDESPTDHQ